jgi:hypothetical protein
MNGFLELLNKLKAITAGDIVDNSGIRQIFRDAHDVLRHRYAFERELDAAMSAFASAGPMCRCGKKENNRLRSVPQPTRCMSARTEQGP